MLSSDPRGAVSWTPDLREILEEIKKELIALVGDRLLRIVLFGSRARGDHSDHSDVDLAIVIRGLTRDLKHRVLEKVAEIELKHLMPVSAFVVSEEEFNRLKERERRIALDIESEGIPL